MKRSVALLVLQLNVCAGVQKQTDRLDIVFVNRTMKGSVARSVSDVYVGSTHEQKSNGILIAIERGEVK